MRSRDVADFLALRARLAPRLNFSKVLVAYLRKSLCEAEVCRLAAHKNDDREKDRLALGPVAVGSIF